MTAAEPLPEPQAIAAVVVVDAPVRTLFARLPDQAGGYERHLWSQAHQRLRRSWEAGWPPGSPWVWADLPGARQAAHGEPADAGMLKFVVPVGVRGFGELVSRPGVTALVTVDRNRLTFLTARFSNEPALRDAVRG